jgi:hypothetical protein
VNDVRAWIGLLAAVVFLAGIATGVMWERDRDPRRDVGRFDDYAGLLQEDFELSPERMGHLRVILREYEADISRLEREHRAAYRAGLEPELRPVTEQYAQIVRDYVIPARHRARYDRQAAGVTLNPTAQ